MVDNLAYLVTNNMDYWTQKIPEFCEAIRLKLEQKLGQPVLSVNENEEFGFKVFAFLDDTAFLTCRPGAGPAGPGGPDAPRRDPEGILQAAFYSGYYCHHGLKMQHSTLPNGMTYNVFPPTSIRRSDLENLHESHFLERVADIMGNQENQLYLHGVSYQVNADLLFQNFVHPNLTSGRLGNLRISEEWKYGQVKQLFSFITFGKKLRLMSMPLIKIIIVGLLFGNAYICLNGSQANSYFNLNTTSLEDWTSHGPHARPIMPDDVHIEFYPEGLENLIIDGELAIEHGEENQVEQDIYD